MRNGSVVAAILCTACGGLLPSGCTNRNADVMPTAGPDAATPSGGATEVGGGGVLQPFTPPTDPGAGGVLFTASGERLALTGYAFPPAQAEDPAFVDGWDVKFTRILTTIDKIVLASAPDKVAGDPSQTDGVVAEVDGPWAIDLHRSDPSYLAGKGGPGEQAVPIAAVSNENGALKTDGTRYAFGFDTIAATSHAKNVNLDAAAIAEYAQMVADGCVVLYVGTATFKGDKSDPSCYPATYSSWPDAVTFRLCFKAKVTYANCQNPDNDPAAPFPNEEHERGIAPSSSKSVIAQVTLHTDHPFWDSVLHDSPVHFDPFAARVVGARDAGATPTVTLEMTKGVDYTAYTDANGAPLQWRYCVDPPTDVHPKLTGPMAFDAETVPHATGDDPATGLRDFYDFTTYDQSTQGHLNSDGLCYVKRNYPSPN